MKAIRETIAPCSPVQITATTGGVVSTEDACVRSDMKEKAVQ